MPVFGIFARHIPVDEREQALEGLVCLPELVLSEASSHDFFIKWDCPEVFYLSIIGWIEDFLAGLDFCGLFRFLSSFCRLLTVMEKLMLSFHRRP